MARYDFWDQDVYSNNDEQSLLVGGISYRLTGNNIILAAYELSRYHNPAYMDDQKGQVVYQLNF